MKILTTELALGFKFCWQNSNMTQVFSSFISKNNLSFLVNRTSWLKQFLFVPGKKAQWGIERKWTKKRSFKQDTTYCFVSKIGLSSSSLLFRREALVVSDNSYWVTIFRRVDNYEGSLFQIITKNLSNTNHNSAETSAIPCHHREPPFWCFLNLFNIVYSYSGLKQSNLSIWVLHRCFRFPISGTKLSFIWKYMPKVWHSIFNYNFVPHKPQLHVYGDNYISKWKYWNLKPNLVSGGTMQCFPMTLLLVDLFFIYKIYWSVMYSTENLRHGITKVVERGTFIGLFTLSVLYLDAAHVRDSECNVSTTSSFMECNSDRIFVARRSISVICRSANIMAFWEQLLEELQVLAAGTE